MRNLGDPLPLVPMTPSTRKDLHYNVIPAGQTFAHRVQGGVIMTSSDQCGVLVTGDGPHFIPEYALRSMLAQCEGQRLDSGHDQVPPHSSALGHRARFRPPADGRPGHDGPPEGPEQEAHHGRASAHRGAQEGQRRPDRQQAGLKRRGR